MRSKIIPRNILSLSENERRDILQYLEKDAAELQMGINLKNPNIVGSVAKDMSYLKR